jgi:hypothetical protein
MGVSRPFTVFSLCYLVTTVHVYKLEIPTSDLSKVRSICPKYACPSSTTVKHGSQQFINIDTLVKRDMSKG